jgi:hypothetical protein
MMSYMSREEDIRLVKGFVSKIIPRRKLGYMRNMFIRQV